MALSLVCGVPVAASAQGFKPEHDVSCAYFSPSSDANDGPPIIFYADLSADEESAVTESPGVGRVNFTLERDTLKFTWVLMYRDLTSPPTGAHVHGPQTPGGEAAVLFNMAPDGVASPTSGSKMLNEGELAYLMSDRIYVNLHTEKYPAGELRGSIRKQRPQC
jgi:hypothetical protein